MKSLNSWSELGRDTALTSEVEKLKGLARLGFRVLGFRVLGFRGLGRLGFRV